MGLSTRGRFRTGLFAATAAGALLLCGAAMAEDAPSAPAPETEVGGVVVTATGTTRSAVALGAIEIQKLLPGVSPLKAIQTLPGVLFETADPWGNNEQNLSLIVHGFTTQQLGYTLDGVPLGDQQYGNYNGLSASRAVSSENVSRVVLSSGAGSLGVASTSNLGGAIETFSRDPADAFGVNLRQTLGSYGTTRSFGRIDTGPLLGGAGYISFLHHDARAWDFKGHQRGDQVNAKYVRDDSHGTLTLYGDWQSKVEPNEDATAYGNQQTAASTYFPYTRPFIYPDRQAGLDYLKGGLPGSPPAALGNNFSNYFSAAQRADVLGYAKYDLRLGEGAHWSNQAYYHHDSGRGIVAGPINQAGLPGLFAVYYPDLVVGSTTSATTLGNIANVFGGTGYEVRTTEYKIDREGLISTLQWQVGDHQLEAGGWYEHNRSSTYRRWYPFSEANNDLTPYDVPENPAFTQYAMQMTTDVVQLHLQDQWRITPTLQLQAGVKSNLQTADGKVLIQQKNLASNANPTLYPSGSITSNEWFLPQAGVVWDVTDHEQIFANVQKNLRQFIPYGAGSNFYGASPWSLGSQAAFEQLKQTVKPETSWTYEAGIRTRRTFEGPISSIEGQANYYHVKFANRLLNVAAYNFINPGAAVLANVGGVTTDGVDVALTVNFGPHFHIYDGVSYNRSRYDTDYNTAANVGGVLQNVVIPVAGKQVPLTPNWLNKTIVGVDFGNVSAQLSADYIGRRYVTYLNDLSVKRTFQLGLQASYLFELPSAEWVRSVRASVNVTNLTNEKGVSTAVVTGPSGGYQAFPLAPRMAFVTLDANF